jgi:glucose-6-phosphate 1-dehydrogenase
MSAIIQAHPLEKLSQEPLPSGDSCVLERKLIPGLYNLSCVGCMNPAFEVLGIGRTPMSSEEFRKNTDNSCGRRRQSKGKIKKP